MLERMITATGIEILPDSSHIECSWQANFNTAGLLMSTPWFLTPQRLSYPVPGLPCIYSQPPSSLRPCFVKAHSTRIQQRYPAWYVNPANASYQAAQASLSTPGIPQCHLHDLCQSPTTHLARQFSFNITVLHDCQPIKHSCRFQQWRINFNNE